MSDEKYVELQPCRSCAYGQRTMMIPQGLQRARICGRFPPNLPMPGPGGQGVQFVQPFVSDEGTCGEWRLPDTRVAGLNIRC